MHLHGMAHSFIELHRLWSMWSVWLYFCDCDFHSVCPRMDKDKKLMEASWWERLTDGRNWVFFLMGEAILSKSLIQFSVDGQGPNYGGGNEDNGYVLQKVPNTHCHTWCPWPFSRPPLTHASIRDPWTHLWANLSQFLVRSLLLFPGFWCAQGFVCALQESVSPVL